MNFLLADLRNVKRMFRAPGVPLTVIMLITLGIGGVTAIFNPTYASLFVPISFPQPDQLVRIGGDIRMFNIRTSSFEKEDALGRIFSNITAYLPTTSRSRFRVSGIDGYKEVYSLLVTEDFFKTLGVQPFMGPGFDGSRNIQSAVISYRFWREEMMRDDDVLGKQIGAMATIVGVMPEGFNFPIDTDVWIRRNSSWELSENTQFLGRLRPGVSIGYAAENLKAIDFNPVPGIVGSGGPILQSLQTFLYGDQNSLLKLLGASAVLFLILVCAGVVNLLISQGANRKQEVALRLILGGTRQNLVFKLIREILPLVVIGSLAGWWTSEIVGKWLWTQFPALQNMTVDLPVKMVFLASMILIVTIIGGLFPSFHATGLNLNTYLKSASGGKPRIFSTREILVGVQFSITLALLIGTGTLLRSIMFSVDFPIGWSLSQAVAVVSVYPLGSVPEASNNQARARSFQDVKHELSRMPEVMMVGYLPIPFSSESIRISHMRMPVAKTLPPQGEEWPSETFVYAQADPDGFNVLGIPLFAGRYFTDDDVANRLKLMSFYGHGRAGGVAIINQAAARRLWPGENAIGKILYDSTTSYLEVVGVVQNYRQTPAEQDFTPTIYTPIVVPPSIYHLLVKLRPGVLLSDFHSNVEKRLSGSMLAPTEFRVQRLSEYVKDAIAGRRMTLQLLGCFAILGILISGLSIYAASTLMVAARNYEFGIRMAMGAQIFDIFLLALWTGLRATLLGLPLGLLIAWALSKTLSSLLIQVNVNDPLVWLASCALLLGITTAAALIPALRATRVNPIDVIRNK